jgi:tol-pal system protein YbgF
MSLQQLQRGALQTARLGFQKVLSDSPTGDRAPDAQFFLGETWAGPGGNADSAGAAYELVVKSFPASPRAASALYKLGLLAESKGNKAGARQYFQRLVDAFPTSDEAALAREKLQAGH